MIAQRLMFLAPFVGLLISGCDDAPMPGYAAPSQIQAAAERCGLRDFEGSRIGSNYDANVPRTVENWATIEDCIYADLQRSGLKATRFYDGANPTPAELARRIRCGDKSRSECPLNYQVDVPEGP